MFASKAKPINTLVCSSRELAGSFQLFLMKTFSHVINSQYISGFSNFRFSRNGVQRVKKFIERFTDYRFLLIFLNSFSLSLFISGHRHRKKVLFLIRRGLSDLILHIQPQSLLHKNIKILSKSNYSAKEELEKMKEFERLQTHQNINHVMSRHAQKLTTCV